MGHTEHDKKWPSVTQVLSIVDKPFLRMWYGKNGTAYCERVKKEAGEFGQGVHEMIACRLEGKDSPTLSERQVQVVNTFEQWQRQSGFTPTEVERKVESSQHEYHGTLDSIGTFGTSDLFVLDWKTSSKIDNLYGCQLAAYAQAYYEETGHKINQGGVVRLDKDPAKPHQIEVKTFNDLNKYLEVFLSCLKVYAFVHPRKR